MRTFRHLLAVAALLAGGVYTVNAQVMIEADLTSQFNSLATTKWTGSTGQVGGAAPKVTTNSGLYVAAWENYCGDWNGGCTNTGPIMKTTVSGLPAGTYKIELYGAAAFTFNRGFGSEAFTGESTVGGKATSDTYTAGQSIDTETGVYLYATTSEDTYSQEIPIWYADNFNGSGLYTAVLDGVVVGANGEIEIGMSKTSKSTNWHVVQLKGVTATVNAIPLFAKALIDAKAYQTVDMADDAKTALNTTISTYENATLTTADEYVAAIKALNDATEAAKAAADAYRIAQYYIDLADGAYYIIDAASRKMMAAGHDYGTRGIVKEFGLDLTLTTNVEAHTVTFDSQVSNGGDSHFLGSNLYMDSPAFGWYLDKQDNGLFYITNDEQYISIDANENLVMSDEPYAWAIVSADAVIAAGIEEFANATAEAPVDATFLITGANFNRNDARNNTWSVSEDCTNSNLSGGNQTNNCAESFHSTFCIQQTIQGVPNGIYRLTAQGFYRQDGSDNEHLPVFFANGETATFPEKTGTENSMSDASGSFSNGLYTIEPIKFTVVDGTITLGAKLEGNTNLWCIWDNFTLTFEALTVTIDEEDDNTAKLEELDGYEADITLTRTLQTGSYNTFAVPFATAIPEGWTVKELTASEFNNATGLLSLTFGDALSIEAGKPYLVKVGDENVVNPTFNDVTIVDGTTMTQTTAVDFIPTLGKTLVTGPTGNESIAEAVLFLGANNTLLNPTVVNDPEKESSYMKGFRAYFQLKGDATQARAFSLDFGDGETTGIKAIDNGKLAIDNVVYDLQGRKVQNAAAKGMYIVNGKKVIIK